jgi:hypothetical protein
MGNLGGSKVNCHQNQLRFNEIQLECPTGRIHSVGNVLYGVISSQVTNQIYCRHETLDDYVKNHTGSTCEAKKKKLHSAKDSKPWTCYSDDEPYTNCTAGLKPDLVDTINTRCHNQTNCTVPLSNADIYTPDYIDLFNPGTAIGVNTFNEGHCGSKAAFFI